VSKINQSVHTHDSLLIENELSSNSIAKLPELNDPKIISKRKISTIGRSYNMIFDKINVKNKNEALSQLTDSVTEDIVGLSKIPITMGASLPHDREIKVNSST
jgi:hypothetical protein